MDKLPKGCFHNMAVPFLWRAVLFRVYIITGSAILAKGISKSLEVLCKGIEAVMVLTLGNSETASPVIVPLIFGKLPYTMYYRPYAI